MTIGTASLTPEATWSEIDALILFLGSLGVKEVGVTYGWGCNAEEIEQPVSVPLAGLLALLAKNIAQGVYHLGDDNLYIGSDNPVLKITLCQDADIHFEAEETHLEVRVRQEWEGRGHRVWP
jgi:hypothetical protein